MLKRIWRQNAIKLEFLGLIAVGLLGATYAIHVQATTCLLPTNQTQIDGPKKQSVLPSGQNASTSQPQPNVPPAKGAALAIGQHQEASIQQIEHPSGGYNCSWLDRAICDSKITDLALVLFTYCLVIVGWATLRSNEQTMQEVERARICIGWGDLIQRVENRVLVQFGATNAGKTAGVIKEYYISFLSQPPKGKRPTYLKEGLYMTEHIDSFYRPSLEVVPIRLVMFDVGETPIICGFIRYIDAFGKEHTTRSCGKIPLHANTSMELVSHPNWNVDD